MKTVKFYKALPVTQMIESVTIVIDEEMPGRNAAELCYTYDAEAKALHAALVCALPGGVLSRLVVELVKSQFVTNFSV